MKELIFSSHVTESNSLFIYFLLHNEKLLMGFKEEVPFILRTKTHLGLYDIEKTIEYNTRWGSSQGLAIIGQNREQTGDF